MFKFEANELIIDYSHDFGIHRDNTCRPLCLPVHPVKNELAILHCVTFAVRIDQTSLLTRGGLCAVGIFDLTMLPENYALKIIDDSVAKHRVNDSRFEPIKSIHKPTSSKVENDNSSHQGIHCLNGKLHLCLFFDQ